MSGCTSLLEEILMKDTILQDGRLQERANKLREFFRLDANAPLSSAGVREPEVPSAVAQSLKHFNIEWHLVPSVEAVPFDDAYVKRLYPTAPRDFNTPREHAPSYLDQIRLNHAIHQGRFIGVETTRKPGYLPGNKQFYGTRYGFDQTADPFSSYFGLAGMMSGTRYAHNYAAIQNLTDVVNDDWKKRSILPNNYRLTICPPAVFNLIGTVFHSEWSDTETLELGFYRDESGNATCYAVGCNAPTDFSYIAEVEGEADWSLLGFRMALVPE